MSGQFDESIKLSFAVAVFLFVTGLALVLVGSQFAPIDSYTHWHQWVTFNLLTCLVIPVALLKGMGQSFHLYGLGLGQKRRSVLWLSIGIVVVVIISAFTYGSEELQRYYPMARSARSGGPAFIWYIATSIVYIFAWEFAFRGYMTFGLYRVIGWWAVPVQAVVFGMCHFGKPDVELMSSFVGGAAQGIIALNTRSILVPFILHAAIWTSVNLIALYA